MIDDLFAGRRILGEFCRHGNMIGAHVFDDEYSEAHARKFFDDAADVRETDRVVWCSECTIDRWEPR